jgi:hypothetical protein
MSSDDPLPQLNLTHRMMLGRVRPDWIRSFDFQTSGGVDQNLMLHATELLGTGAAHGSVGRHREQRTTDASRLGRILRVLVGAGGR